MKALLTCYNQEPHLAFVFVKISLYRARSLKTSSKKEKSLQFELRAVRVQEPKVVAREGLRADTQGLPDLPSSQALKSRVGCGILASAEGRPGRSQPCVVTQHTPCRKQM